MTPPLPWRASALIDPDATYVVTISRLPLRRHSRIPSVLGSTLRIVRELSRSEGLVGYSLKADIVRKTFWTMSVWRSEEALTQFVHSDVHRAAMRELGPHLARPQIETSTTRGANLPPSWPEVQRRLSGLETTDARGTPDSQGTADMRMRVRLIRTETAPQRVEPPTGMTSGRRGRPWAMEWAMQVSILRPLPCESTTAKWAGALSPAILPSPKHLRVLRT